MQARGCMEFKERYLEELNSVKQKEALGKDLRALQLEGFLE